MKNNNLINVGCECWHGAGSRHIKYVTETYGVTDESDCVICHERSIVQNFNITNIGRRLNIRRDSKEDT